MTAKNVCSPTTSHVLIDTAKGIIIHPPISLNVHPILTSKYKRRKYPMSKLALPIILNVFALMIEVYYN